MEFSSWRHFPVEWPFLLAFFLLLGLLFALIQLKILRFAYERMGVPPRYVLAILLFTLLGSSINLPITTVRPSAPTHIVQEHRHSKRTIVRPAAPVILAVNVGGALIPTLLSLYLLVKNRLYGAGFLAVAVVTLVVHWMARPVYGQGVVLPLFIPFLTATVAAIVFCWRKAAPLAYIAGCLGTLIGADLLNLNKMNAMGASELSIGGAGTFDGVFLVGLVAVLLAALVQPRARA
jgi:uncharacterized membrane protein